MTKSNVRPFVAPPKVPLVQTLISYRAQAQLNIQRDVLPALARHQAGDWGDINDADRKFIDRSFSRGRRLFSMYHSTSGREFWIITQPDRSSTTVLLPDEY